MKRARVWIGVSAACVALGLAMVLGDGLRAPGEPAVTPPDGSAEVRSTLPTATPEAYALVEAAVAQVGVTRSYDSAYVQLDYPGGDVPLQTGVCTDVVVRAFRGVGIDLQQEIHEDMAADFGAYPQRWGLTRPDPNIDHRRVPNLQTYFARQGMEVPATGEGRDYLPGDIVTWSVGSRPHIGVVSAEPATGDRHYLIAHNIGRGAQVEDVLFRFDITGHYRWR